MLATLLLTLVPADVSLYTVRGGDFYRVRLSDGWTEPVATLPLQFDESNNVVWDPDTQNLYITSGWYDCDGHSFDWYVTDLTTWTLTETGYWRWNSGLGDSFGPVGVQVAGLGIRCLDCDLANNNQVAAYDPTRKLVWQYDNALGPGFSGGIGVSIVDPTGSQPPTALHTEGPVSGQGFLPSGQFFLAVDPLDGTLYTSGGPSRFSIWQNPQPVPSVSAIDTTNWTANTIPLVTQGLGVGPIAFYPGTHDLMVYTYDGSGFAWLSQVDLTTGELTPASPPFTAPAWQMFFRDE